MFVTDLSESSALPSTGHSESRALSCCYGVLKILVRGISSCTAGSKKLMASVLQNPPRI